MIEVQVAYSPAPREVVVVEVSLAEGSSVAEAVRASGLSERYGLLAEGYRFGIWGRRQALEDVVRAGDRVEIYRALTVDPKEARRQRYRGQRKAATDKEKRPAGAGR